MVRFGYAEFMNDTADPHRTPDPIDEEAAEIDARSPDAPEQIEDLVKHADALGRETSLPGEEES